MTDKIDIEIAEALDFVLDCYNQKKWIKHTDERLSLLMDNDYRFGIMTNKKDNLIKIVKITHYQKF
jgi:hypothetical protein